MQNKEKSLKNWVGFRVDGHFKIGHGHMVRCLELAKELKKFNFHAYFLCQNCDETMTKKIQSYGFPLHFLKGEASEDEWGSIESILNEHKIHSKIMVVDHYELDERWHRRAKQFFSYLVVIDDMCDKEYFADIIINQNYLPNLKDKYKRLNSLKGAKHLVGPEYVLLKEQFSKINPKSRQRQFKKIKHLFISFGGSDPTGETVKVLQALKGLEELLKDVKIDVVIGSGFKNKEEVEKLGEGWANLECHYNPQNMAKLMNQGDLAIGSGGITTWERCYLGLPTIAITVSDNQIETTERLAENNFLFYVGHYNAVDEKVIQHKVTEVFNHLGSLKDISRKGQALVKGKGTQKVAKVIKKLL